MQPIDTSCVRAVNAEVTLCSWSRLVLGVRHSVVVRRGKNASRRINRSLRSQRLAPRAASSCRRSPLGMRC
jgi:hypothetical protein